MGSQSNSKQKAVTIFNLFPAMRPCGFWTCMSADSMSQRSKHPGLKTVADNPSRVCFNALISTCPIINSLQVCQLGQF